MISIIRTAWFVAQLVRRNLDETFRFTTHNLVDSLIHVRQSGGEGANKL